MPIYKQESSQYWYIDIIGPSGRAIRRSSERPTKKKRRTVRQAEIGLGRVRQLLETAKSTFEGSSAALASGK